MLFVLITLWSIAAALLIIDRKNGAARWLSATSFCGGSGALAVTIDERLIPFLDARDASEAWLQFCFQLQAGSSLVSYYGMPFAFLLFALHYNRSALLERYSRLLPILLAVPPLLCLIFTPEYTEEYPIHFRIVILWALPYIGLGTALVLRRREWNRTARQIHYTASLAVLTPVMLSAIMNYVLPSLGLIKMWRYNTWFIAFGLLIFLLAIFNYGFLGIRIRIQKRELDFAMRAITSGSAILNHAIKNDVGKIKLFGEKMKQHALKLGDDELAQDAQVILNASEHIEQMVRRVHRQTKDLKLVQESFDVIEMLEQLLQGLSPQLTASDICLVRDYRYQGRLYGDRVQLSEAIGNVLTNALEAMPGEGRLRVGVNQHKRYVQVEIEDTGNGIAAKDLPSVLEPFYTTKGNQKTNFGLGLAYSYHVARKHGGSLDITSVEGKGTIVSFRLPLSQSQTASMSQGKEASK